MEFICSLVLVIVNVLWNLGNLLLVAAIAVAGMSVGFPIGGGIAWVLGIIVNYILIIMDKGKSEDDSLLLFSGVAVIVVAILLSMQAYKRLASEQKKPTTKGILLSVFAGLLIAFFYGFVVNSLDNSFVAGGKGTLTPFTAIVFFGLGVLLSTFVFNPIFMAKPVQGEPVKMSTYFKGTLTKALMETHFYTNPFFWAFLSMQGNAEKSTGELHS